MTTPTGRKVLIVEDDKFLGGLVAKKLMAAGFQVILLDRGGQAVSNIEKERPQIVLLDLLLPDMSGFDILEKMYKNADLKSIPVIILSNLAEQSDIQKAKNLGAHSFLIKATVNIDAIVTKVGHIIAGGN